MTDIERELYHHGVKGMKWGKRKKSIVGEDPRAGRYPIGTKRGPEPIKYRPIGTKDGPKPIPRPKSPAEIRREQKAKQNEAKMDEAKRRIMNSKTGGTLINRGKAALDVLINGDKDWMGKSTSSDNAVTEARNRGKAAIERLLYSEEQIHNKKFFGEYNPFG